MNLQFTVEGMTCNGCANAVKAEISDDSRVSDVTVDLDAKQVDVTASAELSVADINELLADTPYEAVA